MKKMLIRKSIDLLDAVDLNLVLTDSYKMADYVSNAPYSFPLKSQTLIINTQITDYYLHWLIHDFNGEVINRVKEYEDKLGYKPYSSELMIKCYKPQSDETITLSEFQKGAELNLCLLDDLILSDKRLIIC